MNPQIQRGLLLFEQGRHELAEKELRQAVAADPHDAYTHSLLALCLSERRQFKEASEEARQAIALGPDDPFGHYAMAHVLCDRNRPDEALEAVREAVRLDPHAAEFCALEAQCHHNLKHWEACLAAADRGLAVDAEHVGCANLRAIALVKLGRRSEAGATIDAALSKQPEDATTHANMGWTMLHEGETKKALSHFQEALRLEPGHEWARAGIVEALKARNIVYAVMLKYFLFMGRLSSGVQWGIILGAYFLGRSLSGVARSNPEFAPWILPIRLLLFGFIFMTWLAYPLFNLLLRMNRYGRLALTEEQIFESNWIGGFLGIALVSLAGCLVEGFDSPWITMLAVFGLFNLPLSGLFRCNGVYRKIMMAAAGFVLALGLFAVVQSWLAYRGDHLWVKEQADRAFAALGFFSMGILATTLLSNILAGKEERH